jgi:radical SAM superfamily enzyme YgiQ (UPF0313 family)
MTRLPNLGLSSIAANLDRNLCDIKIVDLIVAGRNPQKYFLSLLQTYQPDVVGFSCMIFQYAKTLEFAKMTKNFNKNIKVVMGGYYPTVDYDVILESADMEFIDFVIRSEGEIAFNELIRALNNGGDFRKVLNLSYKDNGSIVHNPKSKLLNLDEIKPPDRDVRILKKGFHLFGYPADAIETSRGCTCDCDFCSIRSMYGKSFRKYKIERVLNDIRDAQKHGAKSLMITDDNPTLAGRRYKELCEAIIEAKLNKIRYYIQASINGLKNTPGLIETMVKSGARWVFLGIENESDETLEFLDKSNQFKKSDAFEVIGELKEHGAIVFGGIIIGNPEDTEEKVWANYEYAKKLGMDFPVFGILTPYPKTPIRDKLLKQGLIVNLHDYSKYNCFNANLRTKHLSPERLSQLRQEIETMYPIKSGSIWRLLREFPLYFAKLIPQSLIKEPKNVFGFIKGGMKKRRAGREER